MGYPLPGQDGVPMMGGSPNPGMRYPRIGQQMEYLIHRGRYASCVHAGLFDCFRCFLSSWAYWRNIRHLSRLLCRGTKSGRAAGRAQDFHMSQHWVGQFATLGVLMYVRWTVRHKSRGVVSVEIRSQHNSTFPTRVGLLTTVRLILYLSGVTSHMAWGWFWPGVTRYSMAGHV